MLMKPVFSWKENPQSISHITVKQNQAGIRVTVVENSASFYAESQETASSMKTCLNRVLKGSQGMRHVGVQNIIIRMCALETAWQPGALE